MSSVDVIVGLVIGFVGTFVLATVFESGRKSGYFLGKTDIIRRFIKHTESVPAPREAKEYIEKLSEALCDEDGAFYKAKP